MRARKIFTRMSLLLLLLSLGCTVGPDYVRPVAIEKMPAAYKEVEGWKQAQPQNVRIGQRWWEMYQDPELNALEKQVASSNLSVSLAAAQLRQARTLVQAASAGYLPNLSAGAVATRSRSSEDFGSGATVSAFQLPLDFAWELDLWGRVRRGVEASRASAEASAADLAAMTLSAQAELAGAYFQLRVLDAQKQLLEETVGVYRKSLEIANYRFAAGITTRVDVLQAETQLKSTEAQTLDLGVQRAQLEHAIALLIGQPPAAFSLAPATLPGAVPPVPAGLPSELLERRPDIAAAERQMAAANARIGIAQAAYYPTIRLSASGGLSASTLANLFEWPNRFWSVGPAASTLLFDGGLRKARNAEAEAAYDAATASYRQTVLTAFREVEDNLAALRILEQEAEVQAQAVQGAQQVVSLTTDQYQAGILPYLNVLVAQAVALNSERTALNLLGRRLGASVLLVKALGGDWQTERQP